MINLDSITTLVNIYAIILSLIAIYSTMKKIRHLFKARYLRRVWGIKDGECAVIVCSELDEPAKRQWPEPREFIYSMKYGDVDAYFEVVITLLRLYPSIKLKTITAGEANHTRVDLARHIILIGGPDYNSLTERVLSSGKTHYDYRSPLCKSRSSNYPNEIVLYNKLLDEEYCYESDHRDCGYFERFRNPHNPKSQIILIGGSHTIGVTGAIKAFSMAESEEGEIPATVLNNAKVVVELIKKSDHFSVLLETERIGQTISTPVVQNTHVTVQKLL